MLGHEAEEGQPVARGQRVGVVEVEFELAVGVLVVEGVEVPAQFVDGGGHLVQPGEIVDEAAHVVARLGQLVVGDRHRQAAILILLQQEDLALDAEVHAVAQLGGFLELVLERDPGVERVGLALEVVVGGDPGDLGFPGQLDGTVEIGHRGQFVVVGRLAEAVQGIAGVAF